MIGILIISHAPLGAALVACAKHVFSEPPEHFAVLDVVPDTEPQLLMQQATTLTKQVNAGQGVLVLTDLFGGTPSNIATQLGAAAAAGGASERVAVITGVNLPMLLRAITYRHTDLATVVEKAMSGATNGIVNLVSKAPQAQTRKFNDSSGGDGNGASGNDHSQ
ncbi:PTS sugar transporter subunit IIA [Parvibium lacunae]|uniref:PTS EIIA type-4 domain-containing protein n=1 Tax=Parvibium lacunae TaxID=1888893 RepID=A0A368L0N2_9BURK|nr:hypothetical protein [Parvibium lacunae]RCS57109.1 hypothetical protein DU000_09915 [Parvibium lacunae]